MRADVPGQNPESTGGLENVQLWEVLWRLETEAASMNHAAADLIQQDALFDEKKSTWHQRERADWRAAYERPRADWREVYEANLPTPAAAPAAPAAPAPRPPAPTPMPEETIALGDTEPSIDLPKISDSAPAAPTGPAAGSSRRQRPAAFASQIKADAPSEAPGVGNSEVTGAFRNVVYGIETETPAARLRDLLTQRAFDQLWTAGSALDGDKFAAFFAEEGFGPAEP